MCDASNSPNLPKINVDAVETKRRPYSSCLDYSPTFCHPKCLFKYVCSVCVRVEVFVSACVVLAFQYSLGVSYHEEIPLPSTRRK